MNFLALILLDPLSQVPWILRASWSTCLVLISPRAVKSREEMCLPFQLIDCDLSLPFIASSFLSCWTLYPFTLASHPSVGFFGQTGSLLIHPLNLLCTLGAISQHALPDRDFPGCPQLLWLYFQLWVLFCRSCFSFYTVQHSWSKLHPLLWSGVSSCSPPDLHCPAKNYWLCVWS